MPSPESKTVTFDLPPRTELLSLPEYQEHVDAGWVARKLSLKLGASEQWRKVSVTFVRGGPPKAA